MGIRPRPRQLSVIMGVYRAEFDCRLVVSIIYSWSEKLILCNLYRSHDQLSLKFFSCAVKSDAPLPCGNGSFAPAGSTYCHACPVGSQCPSAKLAYHQLCANGSYSVVENATSCSECPAGSKCPDPVVGPVECANGTYSKAGATHCIECPGGHR